MEFTLKEAGIYAKAGKAKEWVIQLLIHTGNAGFSIHIKNHPGTLEGPVKLKLSSLNRICGPEKEMKYFEEKNTFEKRVSEMVKSITDGWNIPPIIIWDKNNELSIADGAHRHEALIRSGLKKYWGFIWKDK